MSQVVKLERRIKAEQKQVDKMYKSIRKSRQKILELKRKESSKKDHRVLDVKVGDRTGIIMLALWDEHVDEIMQGDLIDIKNGYINKFKGRFRLNIGRYGVLEKVEDAAFPTREELMSRYRWKAK